MKVSWRRIIVTALAYVGVIIGAGFASGQEIMQYYVSYSAMGFWGLVLSALLFVIGGIVFLQFGSVYLAREHSDVVERIAPPLVSKIIDLCINVNLFLFGLVMIAGGGTSLHQQFGIPVWMGSALLSFLIFLSSYLDVNRITNVIGLLTPFVITFIVIGGFYVLFTAQIDLSAAFDITANEPEVLPNWFISALNYSGLALMIAISMAFVIGGGEYSPRQAGISGGIGGFLISILLIISFFALTVGIREVQDSSMPMLALIDSIHPVLGSVMSLVIFGMIYNTAISLYYPLAKRASKMKAKSFNRNMLVFVIAGFLISSLGFETLVSTVYPIIGYFGVFVIGLVFWQWIRYRKVIREEENLRKTFWNNLLENENFNQTNGITQQSYAGTQRLEKKFEQLKQKHK